MNIHPSALRHGIGAEDAMTAAMNPVYVSELDEDSPARQFRLGFDGAGRLLEFVVLRFDGGTSS